MPRIRYLKPDFFMDEDLAELPFEIRLSFAGLWCYADKAGRLEDRPKMLKACIWPYDEMDMEEHLSRLAEPKKSGRPFLIRYQSNEKSFIQILNFTKHQKPHHTEKESEIPPPPEKSPLNNPPKGNGDGECQERSTELRNGEVTVNEPLNNGETTVKPPLKKSKPKKKPPAAPPPPPPENAIMTIPLKGNQGNHFVTEEDLKELKETFPTLDVLQSLRECRLWNQKNEKKRKTRRGINAHISNWLKSDIEDERNLLKRSEPSGSPTVPYVNVPKKCTNEKCGKSGVYLDPETGLCRDCFGGKTNGEIESLLNGLFQSEDFKGL